LVEQVWLVTPSNGCGERKGQTMSTHHVIPVGDLIIHTDSDCLCGPTVEAVPREDGAVGWLYTHHPLDNREAIEKGADDEG
jgi:hypothetical protein